MDELLLVTLILVVVNGVFDAVVVAWLAGKRSRQALMRWIQEAAESDGPARESMYQLMDTLVIYASTRQIETGETIKVATDKVDAEGKTIYKEVDEVLSPIQLMARTIGSYVIMKFKGSVGGTKNQMKQMLMDEAAESGIGLSPAALQALARGKVGPALAEVGLPFLMEKLKKPKEPTFDSQGGGKW